MHFFELKIPPLLLMFIFALLIWLSSPLLPQSQLTFPVRLAVLVLCLGGGLLVTFLGALAFNRAQTTVNPVKPETSSSLVDSGIYRITRNPMYVGMTLALAGWALFLNSPISLIFTLLFSVYLTFFQIKPEERMLRKLFQQEYINYCAKVKRWL